MRVVSHVDVPSSIDREQAHSGKQRCATVACLDLRQRSLLAIAYRSL
jgi:hypothetical protein